MSQLIRVLSILILFLHGGGEYSLYAQSNGKSLLTMLSASELRVQTNPNKGYRIERFVLGKSKRLGIEQNLVFERVYANKDFVSLLKSTNAFAVLSEVPRGVIFKDNLFSIGQWTAQFEFDPLQPIGKRPVLLIKSSDIAISDLVADNKFAGRLTRSSSIETVKHYIEKIKDHIEELEQKGDDDDVSSMIKNVYTQTKNYVLEDPYWNGIIGLNIKLDQSSLPSELQFLASSIGSLQWDIIGFELNQNEELTPAFGIIDYAASPSVTLANDQTVPYLFRKLFISFENSKIKTFLAEVEVDPDFVIPFWSKNGQAFNDYELDKLSKNTPPVYLLKGTVQFSKGRYRYFFRGEYGRYGDVLLKSLMLSEAKK